MNEYEKVEKLREKANISYEEAKAALEHCSWDLLDAIVYLEREGKLSGDKTAQHSTRTEPSAEAAPENDSRSRFSERAATFWDHFKRLVQIGNENSFIISKNDKQIISLPMTAMVIILLCINVWLFVLLAAGLFFGLRYSIHGEQLGTPQVNDAMDKAANAAENVRETVEDRLRKEK